MAPLGAAAMRLRRTYVDPRGRLPPEAKRFLATVRRHFGLEAIQNVYVFHKPIPSSARKTEIGNSNRAAESEKL